MLANVRVITPPATEPITVTEAKVHCRIDDEEGDTEHPECTDPDDTLLAMYISAARAHIENLTGMAIGEQTLQATFDDFPRESYIVLPRATPLNSIVSVTYRDLNSNETTMPDSYYMADVNPIPGRLVLAPGKSWPSFWPDLIDAVRVRYKAGLPDASSEKLPEPIKLAMLMLVAALYENREKIITSEVNANAMASDLSILYNIDSFLTHYVSNYIF